MTEASIGCSETPRALAKWRTRFWTTSPDVIIERCRGPRAHGWHDIVRQPNDM